MHSVVSQPHAGKPGPCPNDPNDVPLSADEARRDPPAPKSTHLHAHLPFDLERLVYVARNYGDRDAAMASIDWLEALVADPTQTEPPEPVAASEVYQDATRPPAHPELAGLLRAAYPAVFGPRGETRASAASLAATDWMLDHPLDFEPPRLRPGFTWRPGCWEGEFCGWSVTLGKPEWGSAAGAALNYSRCARRKPAVVFVPEFDAGGNEAGYRKVGLVCHAAHSRGWEGGYR